MKIYMATLKENVVLNAHILNYFASMGFTVINYHPNLKILKLQADKTLTEMSLKYILSIEEDKSFNL
ncbi:hypothetical protein GCM10022291_05900 [Postechiella marina]|uniref:Uncharacterized protein n=1 Tax=Postechiella marina TaxID=943941 RepID=A0ABP8C1J1_9FLAO